MRPPIPFSGRWRFRRSSCEARCRSRCPSVVCTSTLEGLSRRQGSYRRSHEYLTLVADMQARRVVFVTPGRDAKTIKGFAAHLSHCSLCLAVYLPRTRQGSVSPGPRPPLTPHATHSEFERGKMT
ncbi:transposase [Paraburkholderia aspalathi]|nr:transposase [Paraburkholderia aspalathi]